MAKGTKKVKASEITGELARMQRVFEVFKDAADIANVLAASEAMERKLDASIKSLKKEEEQLDAQCDTLAHKIDNRKADLASLDVKVTTAEAEYQGILRTATQKANSEAAQITGGATAELSSLRESIKEAKTEERGLREDIRNASQELSDVYKRIEEVKANALKALA